MIRPTAAFFVAALAAIGLALGAGYALYPPQGDAAKLSVAEPSRTETNPVGRKNENLHVVREHPLKEGHLVSPFLPEHPTREQAKAAKSSPAQKPESKKIQQASPKAKEQEIRLVGIVSSETGRRAILAVGKRQILLSPGEEKEGVMLVSLTENTATISTATRERELSLSSGIAK